MEKQHEKGQGSDKDQSRGTKSGSRESDIKKKSGLGEDETTRERNTSGDKGDRGKTPAK